MLKKLFKLQEREPAAATGRRRRKEWRCGGGGSPCRPLEVWAQARRCAGLERVRMGQLGQREVRCIVPVKLIINTLYLRGVKLHRRCVEMLTK